MDQTQPVDQTQPAVELPRRPRVLPGLAVLRRGDHEVQIGIDPRHGVLLDGMSEDLIEMLPAMNGHATVPELLDRFSDERSRQAAMVLLTSLADAGLLDDASPPDGDTGPHTPARLSADATAWALRTGYPRRRLALNRQQAAVAVRGEGRLGVAVACLLAAAGVGWVDFGALGKVRAEDTGTGYLDTDVDRPRQEAGLAAIHRSVCTARTGTLPPSRKPDLAVLTDLVVPSPSMIAPLHAEGVPYMLVRMRDGTGVVGPLIVPGRSSCPNCMDLQRTDLDPTWPRLALQLAGRLQPGELAATQAAAGFAAAQALLTLDWWLTGVGTPALWNTSLEIDTVTGTVTSRPWEPHPDCRCGAARAEEASV
ncbi:TOMM precursor leader peptide-binding protein [Kutzneria kofuensis]|uniref:Bacteriocin biosynthesis cyclodehydratase domain-containing protein n=1 Tax=Kutzneria kofuensis TaxID=103725 RepID=A0A7W9KGS0_9PSEU|nr:TOMM precursor leader peptide-binding protein [Kutzneria kofuensis]MBB5891514.1 bacteriocin biosynthesis cyclodehydratase domain-containing protein [Kutzneria kofuensis]